MIVDFQAAKAARFASPLEPHGEGYAVSPSVQTATPTGYAVLGGRAHEGAHTHAHAREDWVSAFAAAFGSLPDEHHRADAAYYLGRGMAEAVVRLAIQAAADAPRPSWRYALAVMANCMRDGALDADGWARRQQLHADRRAGQRQYQGARVEAQRYTQREYTREELMALFVGGSNESEVKPGALR